ncbi:hypothetical protein [Aeromicrobium terrae]|uniref:Uncharacterized protein n=1 Tax=Aeromicrobium terrae TaxID=2498846 RepID=A0A5C8NLM0_9ACTN|nr:hypothetical protein [Aeromicrobium terrae]TXL62744.1 hypothetical protein FHP06_00410 [Aeromicrobium terrae]
MRLNLDRSGPWIAVAGLFVVLWLAISTVIYAPWWGVLLHVAVVAAYIPLVRSWARTKPSWCTWIPLFALVTWVGVNAVGVGLLDWHV